MRRLVQMNAPMRFDVSSLTPAAQLQSKAMAMLRPCDKLALRSDSDAYPGKVLLAIARPNGALVLQIDAAEYDGVKVLRIAGMGDVFDDGQHRPDVEELKLERKALRQRKTKKST